MTENDELSQLGALELADAHWSKFVRVIVAGLIVTDEEKNVVTGKSEQLILQVGVYMHDKDLQKWVQRFPDINLTEYGIIQASE